MFLASAIQVHHGVPIGCVTGVTVLANATTRRIIVQYDHADYVTAVEPQNLFVTEAAAWVRVAEMIEEKRAAANEAWQVEIDRCMKNSAEHLPEQLAVG